MRIHVAGLLVMLAACSDGAGPPTELPPLDAVGTAVRALYQREFGIDIPRPAIFSASTCAGIVYLTTVAYLPAGTASERTLYVMHTTLDGVDVSTSYDGVEPFTRTVRTPPVGTYKVLTVVLTYPETVTSAELPALEAAQATINQQHRDFAQSRGYAAPLVQFAFTNVLIPGVQVADPRSLDAVAPVIAGEGVVVDDYDIIAVINIDPAQSEGGFASGGFAGSRPFVYMGNFGLWDARLTLAQWQSVANASYHHEIGHHWGWGHGWSPVCGRSSAYTPFITEPVLYGWEDTDGDRIPEIVDPTPYGRSP